MELGKPHRLHCTRRATDVAGVRMLGLDEPLDHDITDGMLTLRMPERLPVSPAHVLRLDGGVRPAGGF